MFWDGVICGSLGVVIMESLIKWLYNKRKKSEFTDSEYEMFFR